MNSILFSCLIIILIVGICGALGIFIHRSVIEGLQENNTPPLAILTYDASNISQVYHKSYNDMNIHAIGGFALPVYYTPHTYIYASKPYVPDYVDTIYMSSLTGLSNVAQYYDTSYNPFPPPNL